MGNNPNNSQRYRIGDEYPLAVACQLPPPRRTVAFRNVKVVASNAMLAQLVGLIEEGKTEKEV
jgi:hypothetical protein